MVSGPVEKLAFDGAVVCYLAFVVVGRRVFAFVTDLLAQSTAAGAKPFVRERRKVEIPHCGRAMLAVKRWKRGGLCNRHAVVWWRCLTECVLVEEKRSEISEGEHCVNSVTRST